MAKTTKEVKKVKKNKSEKEVVKSKKDLTPLEKARLAKGKGGKSAKAGKSKKKGPTWKAPEEFKPHFLEVSVKTDKDGLFSTSISGTRYQGSYNPEAEDKKKFAMESYDPDTLRGILARISAVTYKSNVEKRYPDEIKNRVKVKGSMRLPANTHFKLVMRVAKKAADDSLTVAFKHIMQGVKSEKTGRIKAIELDKKDPVYRSIRKSKNILPAAFKEVKTPPKKTRKSKKDDSDE
jgi:hypothetical protein